VAYNQQQQQYGQGSNQQYPGQQQQQRGYHQGASSVQQAMAAVASVFRPPPPALRGSYTANSYRNAQVGGWFGCGRWVCLGFGSLRRCSLLLITRLCW
jgi:hypothetical protein